MGSPHAKVRGGFILGALSRLVSFGYSLRTGASQLIRELC